MNPNVWRICVLLLMVLTLTTAAAPTSSNNTGTNNNNTTTSTSVHYPEDAILEEVRQHIAQLHRKVDAAVNDSIKWSKNTNSSNTNSSSPLASHYMAAMIRARNMALQNAMEETDEMLRNITKQIDVTVCRR